MSVSLPQGSIVRFGTQRAAITATLVSCPPSGALTHPLLCFSFRNTADRDAAVRLVMDGGLDVLLPSSAVISWSAVKPGLPFDHGSEPAASFFMESIAQRGYL